MTSSSKAQATGASSASPLIPIERIDSRIYLIRGQKVLLDSDLAELYGVETRILNRAVTRNLERFPEDFMFTLTREEIVRISQFGTSSVNLKFSKTISVFTEQGVAMLSGVLRSPQAVQVNIEIMRAFVRLRQLIASSADLSRKLRALEKKYDDQFKIVFEAIRELMSPIDEDDKAREIGFHTLAKSAPSKTKKS
ncbi:ORF6N domain-containing protein [Nibricoccus aquaticus]|uniref:ORF6N domain-containing protein n=1 Tax=Nibricoccus aquaticus TaxID=2576891 RepID=UPI001FE3BAB9|nr:ORF6N domain-containing protein [Nibricoccus aquaticus]